ncbi:hypothetical protein BKA80DRAFT_284257 [Phyllosticta citrichinensis]
MPLLLLLFPPFLPLPLPLSRFSPVRACLPTWLPVFRPLHSRPRLASERAFLLLSSLSIWLRARACVCVCV